MQNIRNKKQILIYFIAIIFLVFLSSWQALNFHFWKDDWSRLWMAYYRPELLLNLLGLPDHPGMTIEQLFFGKFFGLNPFLWQLEGLILKIFASLSVSLMIWGITRSKVASYMGGGVTCFINAGYRIIRVGEQSCSGFNTNLFWNRELLLD